MNITVLGAGNGGTATAADLTQKGHKVTWCKTSNQMNDKSFDKIVELGKHVVLCEGENRTDNTVHRITRDIADAISEDTNLIIVFIQCNYQEQLVKRLIPYLHDGQIVLMQPGYLSTLYFLKYAKDLDLTIVEAESSPMDCRIEKPGEVSVMFRNVRNPISIYPKENQDCTMTALETLGYNFTPLNSPIEAALHNPNLIVHTIGAIMSIPRIEYTHGDYWMYKEVFTESIWNLVQGLDTEKRNLLKAYSLADTSYEDACKFRNSHNLNLDSKEVFYAYAADSSVAGPVVSNSRYITEDVPEGLVLLESMGCDLGIDTPVCTSLINIADACLGKDFRKNGRSIKNYHQEYKVLLANGRISGK